MTLRRRSPRKARERLADSLWAQVVKRPGRCERCGSTWNLEAAHIIRRRHGSLRWNELNGLCLCSGCHVHLDSDRDLMEAFVTLYRGPEVWTTLQALKENTDYAKSIDVETVIPYLRDLLKVDA